MEGASDVAGVEGGRSLPDVRLVGFASRASLLMALAWIDACTDALGSEMIGIDEAIGRTLAAPFTSEQDWPTTDCAAVDGYAMRAAESEGAGDYNPLLLALMQAQSVAPLPPGSVSIATAGLPLPLGADAVLPFDAAQRNGAGMMEVLAPVAPGTGVNRRGCELRAGMEIVAGLKRLRPQDVAFIAATGTTRVAVVRRPRMRLVVARPKVVAGHDALTPMLSALVARDGGVVEISAPADAGRAALAQAVAGSVASADLVLVAGRSGAGMDDEAPLAIGDVGGRLDLHGIAMRPGGSAGLGWVGGVPGLLLPGAPLACLASYDMLAARAVRRLAGLHGTLPYHMVDAALDRKIVSAVGFVDLVRVRMADRRATPLGSAEEGGLAGAVRADGFVIVPEASEGYAPGSSVRVHLYEDQRGYDDQHGGPGA